MHEGESPLDLSWFSQLILTVFFIAIGVLYLVRNTAAKYFEVGSAGFERNHRDEEDMTGLPVDSELCAVCGKISSKKCSRCKSVRYCSLDCQKLDWNSGHKTKCKNLEGVNLMPSGRTCFGLKRSSSGSGSFSTIALVPERGTFKITQKPREVLFPYNQFVKYFNWDKLGFVPCGLINCGNSCFANVVLQCLSSTRPLVAYLLEKGHKRECRRNDWCFFCEFQTHVERASQTQLPFSPINIISRLPNIGGTLGYGRQEDAHEFMRFAIDTMQSVCLDEFGGEKVVPLSSQETTLIQHIFGGHLQSQVMCIVCNNISNQYENMMDLTVEIHGDAASLEECLDQFTAKEWLQGENMYKCDQCNDYVKAWKRLAIYRAPNILTIALKRFQGGRFGKLNKRVSFPETLDLGPYMSEGGDGTDTYKLYAVIVHLDMLNASFFGHYICYIKDFRGHWYRIDDSEVVNVELEEVLSQRAYMLLYSRIQARPSCLRPDQTQREKNTEKMETESGQKESVESSSILGSISTSNSSLASASNCSSSRSSEPGYKNESSIQINSKNGRECNRSGDMTDLEANSSAHMENESSEHQEATKMAIDCSSTSVPIESEIPLEDSSDADMINVEPVA